VAINNHLLTSYLEFYDVYVCMYVRPLVIAEARVLSLTSPLGIFGGRCGTKTGFCSSGSAAVPRQLSFCHCVTFIFLSSDRRSVGPFWAAIPTVLPHDKK